jgi:RNA polymerase sigma-70 factor, ECF subfamily
VPDPHHQFLKLYTAAQPALRRFVLAHVPDFHEAEDALQRSATVLWDKFAEFRSGSDFTAWAFGVARREVLHSRRSAARSRLVLSDDLSEQLGHQLAAEAQGFDERRAFLSYCLGKLPEALKRTVDMKYRQGRSTAKIAEALGATANAVRITLCRARQAMADCLRRSAGNPA